MRILLVEDEERIADFVMRGLKAERFVVDWTTKADEATRWAKINGYDAAILDLKLFGESVGLTICKTIREKACTFPIIILSATHDTAIKIESLNSGADDYLTKPFSLVELIARIRALLRREKTILGPCLKVDDLEMDINAHLVRRGREEIRLNRKELSLLEYLMRHPGMTLTRPMILEKIWDTSIDSFTNTVDVHIRFLRRKIDDGHRKKIIHTVHGYGYQLKA
jgi:DNA-binding response OmpR family regulator